MKSFFQKIWKPLLLLVPTVIGMIGFWQEGESLLQALFNCVCMYVLNYQDPPANIWIELSRWLAPLATASGLVLVLSAVRVYFRRFLAYCTQNSVAVYGTGPEKNAILKALGIQGIPMGHNPVKAKKYILVGTEEENLAYYRQNETIMAGRDVYLKCQSLPAQASAHANLHLFCPEETAARFYWKEHCPYLQSAACGHQMKIVILGFDKLGQELLLQALQNNIFDPKQRIEYHVFGPAGSFFAIYQQLSQISDPVTLHPEPWYDALDLLAKADRIIVTQQEQQTALLRELTFAVWDKPIHVFASQSYGAVLLPNLIYFDWLAATHCPENILDTHIHIYAKRINLRYAHLYNGIEETDTNREQEWNALSTFTRYSNISAADYHEVQKKILHWDGLPDPMEPDCLERFSELEHIRWCRYHYLNNWQYGIPENGEAKDPARRIHKCLIPYDKLPEAEKEKDRENIRILFTLDAEF